MSKSVIKRLKKIYLKEPIAIVGFGVTGKSFKNLLEKADISPDILEEKNERFSKETFNKYNTLLLSSGICRYRECFSEHKEKIINDVLLFSMLTEKPIYAVTGSNGKTTTVTLIEDLCKKSEEFTGKKYITCGNIGLPVLSAVLEDDNVSGYVLELSSYQLEDCKNLRPTVGVLLNISEDHLDRYAGFNHYANIKLNLVRQSKISIINADDKNTLFFLEKNNIDSDYYFTKNKEKLIPDSSLCGYINDDTVVINKKGSLEKKEINIKNIILKGEHNKENILAALIIARYMELHIDIKTLLSFNGLLHRYQVFLKKSFNNKEITFINDSKATNVDATKKAILATKKPCVLLLGGDAKRQDFSPLKKVIKEKVILLLIYGKDKEYIKDFFKDHKNIELINTLEDAVEKAYIFTKKSKYSTTILLSPACASFDQFKNYQVRGDIFMEKSRSCLN